MTSPRFAKPCIDCHVHLRGFPEAAALDAYRRRLGIEAVCIQSLPGNKTVNGNPGALAAKAAYPGAFYVFGALDHSAHFSVGRVQAPGLAAQVDRLRELGADGVKMLENKPTTRKILDIPVDSDYFEPLFARLEETAFPVLWHVADPETFWDASQLPAWAREKGWGYDATHVAKEQLYTEVGRVLKRHPRLRIIFAHFYFLSADLPRAARLLDAYEGVHLDLAPGIELLYNLSRDTAAARAFFTRYADRILFGTDVDSTLTAREADLRCGLVKRWLETGETYRIPDGADMLLGPPEDGEIKGLALSEAVRDKICRGNFARLAGARPAPVKRDALAAECERIAAAAEVLAGPAGAAPAREALKALAC